MPPLSLEAHLASKRDHLECLAAIRTGSRSFYTASQLLPYSVRSPAYGLYAFCRLSDDAVDIDGGSSDALSRLYHRLDRACEGRPLPFAADRSMADLMRRYAIPRAVPEALLEGLGWDTEGRRYQTLEDLQGYAARVAATVGVMMTLLMRVRAPSALARACDLGVAMQLTNIARDVGEDARAGRIYLPLQWLDEAGVDVADFLRDPRLSPELASVIARLLAEADRLYQRSRAGVAELPGACRPAILAASTIYAEIGREVEKHSHDSITRRARVTGRRKLALLAHAAASAARLASAPPAPPLPATAFLVDAVTHSRMAVIPDSRGIAGVRRSFLRVLDIFEQLERSEQFGD
jgi:phytoene synthase